KDFKLLFRKYVDHLLEKGQRYEALAEYKKYEWALSKDVDPLSSDFVLKLARAAADLEMGALSRDLMASYRQMTRSRERSVASEEFDPEKRMKASEEHLTEARALWIMSGTKAEEKIQEHLGKVSEEYPFSYEGDVIRALT